MTDSERGPARPATAERQPSAAPAAGIPAPALMLPFRPPFDWAGLTGFLAPRAIPGVEAVRAGAYFRTVEVAGAHGWISVRPASSEAALAVTVHCLSPEALLLIAARVRHLFDLDADPEPIAAHLALDPALAPLVAARPGLRVPGAWDGFELAVRAILGQQVSVARATVLAGKLASLAGQPLPPSPDPAPDGLTRLSPTPAAIAAIAEPGAALGMPRARAVAITALARAALADPDLLASADDLERSVARLATLPGIGEWTAQYIAMRVLHLPDAFPHSDIGLIRALETDGRRPSPREVLDRARAWRPYRAYAALHLWNSDSAGAQTATPRPAGAG